MSRMTEGGGMFFQIAKPLAKEEFLKVFREAVLLTQLLFAPFGLHEETASILGHRNAIETYTQVFQQFEDLVSKRIFAIRGFDDDCIIASMHEYAAENHDAEVLRNMQEATAALHNMLAPPSVVEFDFSYHAALRSEVNVVTASTAALLLRRVLDALVPTLYGSQAELRNGEYYCDGVSLYKQDLVAARDCDTHIPLSSFSPACEFAKNPFCHTSLRSVDAVKTLLMALRVPAHLLAGNSATESTTTEKEVVFSLQQYHCLLDLFGDSEEVSSVLALHCDSASIVTDKTINAVRSGLLLGSLNLSAHPTVCHVVQLTDLLSASKSFPKENNGTVNEPQERARSALDMVMLSIERREKAKEAAEGGDFEQAIALLSDGLLDGDDRSESSVDSHKFGQEDKGNCVCTLPSLGKAELWTDRATYASETGDTESALEDLDMAITMMNQFAPAYSLRSKLRLEALAEKEDEDRKEEAVGSVEDLECVEGQSAEQKVKELEQAAEDGLLAFLLAGSSDSALAASAEDAAREACRHSAKSIFRDRKLATAQVEEGGGREGKKQRDNLPRSWLVGSYFSAYEPLSAALSVYCTNKPKEEEEQPHSADLEDAEETSDNLCDIDEGNAVQLSLPQPPVHLRNSNTPCEKDTEAYALLVALVELLETVTYNSTINAISSNVTSEAVSSHFASTIPEKEAIQWIGEIASVHQRDVIITPMSSSSPKKRVRSVVYSLLDFAEGAGVDAVAQALCGLVVSPGAKSSEAKEESLIELEFMESGSCSVRETHSTEGTAFADCDNSFTVDSDEIDVQMKRKLQMESATVLKVQPCSYFRAALDLLRGSLNSESVENSAGLFSIPEHMHNALISLTSEEVTQLTGVVFNSDGSIHTVEAESAPACIAPELSLSSDDSASSVDDKDRRDDSYSDDDANGDEQSGFNFATGASDAKAFFKRAFGLGGSQDDDDDDDDDDNDDDDNDESEWETVDGSENESVVSHKSNEEREVKKGESDGDGEKKGLAASTVSPIQTQQQQSLSTDNSNIRPSYLAPFQIQKQSSPNDRSHSERISEVASALKDVEKQMRAHNLADPNQYHQESKIESSIPAPEVPPAAVEVVNAEVDPQPHVRAEDKAETAVPESCISTGPKLPVSHRLRARLLNICSSIAYMAGDASGAVQCLRQSLLHDPDLLDSRIKLGSLLVDMDEMREASRLLKTAHKRCPSDHITLLHLAEMNTHKNKFDEAVQLLRKARKITETAINGLNDNSIGELGAGGEGGAWVGPATARLASARAAVLMGGRHNLDPHQNDYLRRMCRAYDETLANVVSLLGINLFRQNPTRPEIALHVLQSALSNQFADKQCPILLLCSGEVYSQAGDMVTALECFQKAQRCAPNNPLPYINAARTYQQLNQVSTAEKHLQAALLLDPAMAMVRVDLAQNLLMTGKATQAIMLLDEALMLAMQVSEIRDVLTARCIANMQVRLEERGLYSSSGARSINC